MKKIYTLFFILFYFTTQPVLLFATEITSEHVAHGIELLILPIPPSIIQADIVQSAPETTPDLLTKTEEDTEPIDLNDAAQTEPDTQKTDYLPTEIIVLRVEPEQVAFELHLASNTGKALSLEQWAQTQDLAIATNAGMFLPDRLTNTGYMRYNGHINNNRIVKNFGSFFVASPKTMSKTNLKSAALLDRQADAWEDILPEYKLVIQNYRLINEKGNPIWLPDGKRFSTSALAQDSKGRILFIFCAYPLNGYNFARAVLALPLNVTRLMYLEGGSPAALVLNTPAKRQVWNNSGILGGFFPPSPVPNILGVKIKSNKDK